MEPELRNTSSNIPTLPKRWGIWLMIPLVIGTCVLCVISARWKESLEVQRVLVDGSRIIPAQQLYAMSGITIKSSLYGGDMYAVRNRILAQPFIKSVSVHRQYPDVVRIRVKEREPIATLNNGSMYYLDEESFLLPYVQTTAKLDLPMINGVSETQKIHPGDHVSQPEIQQAIQLLQVAQVIDSSMYHFISEVNMNGGGDIILYSTDVGVPIYLGRGDIPKKLLTLQSFWGNFLKTGNAEKLKYVDLRFDDQVVVRWQTDEKQPSTKAAL